MHDLMGRRPLWVLRQVCVVTLGVVVYFGVRGLTESEPRLAVDHAHDLLSFERALGLDQEQRLQALLHGRDWLADLANWVYIWGHWPVIGLVLLWLGLRHRVLFLRLRNAMIASGLVGLLVFATYPVAPPRLVDLGLIDTVTQRSHAYRVLQPPAFVNQYAALPSLHVGWDLLVGLTVAAAAGGALLRWIGRLMPLLMAAAVVLTANHYLIDGVAGAALALVGLAVAVTWERRAPAAATTHPGVQIPRPRAAPQDAPLQARDRARSA